MCAATKYRRGTCESGQLPMKGRTLQAGVAASYITCSAFLNDAGSLSAKLSANEHSLSSISCATLRKLSFVAVAFGKQDSYSWPFADVDLFSQKSACAVTGDAVIPGDVVTSGVCSAIKVMVKRV